MYAAFVVVLVKRAKAIFPVLQDALLSENWFKIRHPSILCTLFIQITGLK